MARIEIEELPKDIEINRREMRDIVGGVYWRATVGKLPVHPNPTGAGGLESGDVAIMDRAWFRAAMKILGGATPT